MRTQKFFFFFILMAVMAVIVFSQGDVQPKRAAGPGQLYVKLTEPWPCETQSISGHWWQKTLPIGKVMVARESTKNLDWQYDCGNPVRKLDGGPDPKFEWIDGPESSIPPPSDRRTRATDDLGPSASPSWMGEGVYQEVKLVLPPPAPPQSALPPSSSVQEPSAVEQQLIQQNQLLMEELRRAKGDSFLVSLLKNVAYRVTGDFAGGLGYNASTRVINPRYQVIYPGSSGGPSGWPPNGSPSYSPPSGGGYYIATGGGGAIKLGGSR